MMSGDCGMREIIVAAIKHEILSGYIDAFIHQSIEFSYYEENQSVVHQ